MDATSRRYLNALKRLGRTKSAERERKLSAAVEHFCGAMLAELQAASSLNTEGDVLIFPGNLTRHFRSGELH